MNIKIGDRVKINSTLSFVEAYSIQHREGIVNKFRNVGGKTYVDIIFEENTFLYNFNGHSRFINNICWNIDEIIKVCEDDDDDDSEFELDFEE